MAPTIAICKKFVSAPKIHKRTKINLSLIGVDEKNQMHFFHKNLAL